MVFPPLGGRSLPPRVPVAPNTLCGAAYTTATERGRRSSAPAPSARAIRNSRVLAGGHSPAAGRERPATRAAARLGRWRSGSDEPGHIAPSRTTTARSPQVFGCNTGCTVRDKRGIGGAVPRVLLVDDDIAVAKAHARVLVRA